MQYQRDATGGEIAPLAGNLFCKLLRHLAMYFGEVDAPFLEHGPVHNDASSAAAAALALPALLAEPRLAVELLQAGADTILKRLKIHTSTLFHGDLPPLTNRDVLG